jgi:hypothetical protein
MKLARWAPSLHPHEPPVHRVLSIPSPPKALVRPEAINLLATPAPPFLKSTAINDPSGPEGCVTPNAAKSFVPAAVKSRETMSPSNDVETISAELTAAESVAKTVTRATEHRLALSIVRLPSEERFRHRTA